MVSYLQRKSRVSERNVMHKNRKKKEEKKEPSFFERVRIAFGCMQRHEK